MKPCAYTRRADCGGYEYGHIALSESATKNEKRTYIPLGIKPTIDEALKANQMALKGLPRFGNTYVAPFSWSDLYDPQRDPPSEL